MRDVVESAALKGGQELLRLFSGDFRVDEKGSRDLVTEADVASEKIILAELRKSFPNHNFLSEEEGSSDNRSDYTWIVDPLDGTVNFASRNPLFAISIALQHKSEVVLACIYLPYFNEMFFAEKDRGAMLNGKTIKVANSAKLQESISCFGAGIKSKEKVDAMNKILSAVMPLSRSVQIHGSTPLSLAFVSCGRVDNYVTYKSDVFNMAAGALLIKEAGGVITDYQGNDFNINSKNLNVIASNKNIHQELQTAISRLNF